MAFPPVPFIKEAKMKKDRVIFQELLPTDHFLATYKNSCRQLMLSRIETRPPEITRLIQAAYNCNRMGRFINYGEKRKNHKNHNR